MLNKTIEVNSSLHTSNQLSNYQQLHTGLILFLRHTAEFGDPENKSNFYLILRFQHSTKC